MQRSVTYFDLLEAFKQGGCPVCTLLEKQSRSHLDSLYYEFVNDPGVRSSLRQSRGFCNWHAWLSTEIRSSETGIAIIYKDLLDREVIEIQGILEVLRKRNASFRPFSLFLFRDYSRRLQALIKGWKLKKTCPICQERIRFTHYYLNDLLDQIVEEDFQSRFRASEGLCLRHFQLLVDQYSDHPNLYEVMGIQLDKYRNLSCELSEFSRKCNYQFRDEPMGPESDSWRRVIEQFVGKRELRGNEMWPKRGQTPETSWPASIKRSVRWAHRTLLGLRKPTQRNGLTCRRSPGAKERVRVPLQ